MLNLGEPRYERHTRRYKRATYLCAFERERVARLARQTTLRQRVLGSALLPVPVRMLQRARDQDPLIIYYHMVSNEHVPHVRHLFRYKTVEQFGADIDYLALRFKFIIAEELVAHYREGVALPPRSAMLTFDDGFAEMAEIVAPLLCKKGVPATFFICSALVDNRGLGADHKMSVMAEELWDRCRREGRCLLSNNQLGAAIAEEGCVSHLFQTMPRDPTELDQIAFRLGIDFSQYLRQRKPYLSTEQVRSILTKGFSVGAHGVDHRPYSSLSIDEQKQQTSQSLAFLKSVFGVTNGLFAFPHGDVGSYQHYLNELSREGVLDLAFGTSGMQARNPLLLPRVSLEKPFLTARKSLRYHLVRQRFK